MVDGAVRRDKHVRHANIFASGTQQTERVPRVGNDLVVRSRQKKVAHLNGLLGHAGLVSNESTKDDPIAVIGTGGVLPLACETEPAVYRHGAALWSIW